MQISARIFLVFVFACLSAVAQTKWGGAAPPARVITVHDSDAFVGFRARPEIILEMVERGITNLTGKPTPALAWGSLVSTQDVVGIKVFSAPGPYSGTRPAVVSAVVKGLLAAGVPPRSIIVWDKQTTDLRLAGFFELADRFGIRVEGSAQAGYDEGAAYDTSLIGTLLWGDLEFGKKGAGVGRRSFFSRLVSKEITRIINIPPLLNHNHAGVSGNLYSLASGSVDNFNRFEPEGGRLASAVPEIYALRFLSDKVAVSIVDALLCQYEGGERGLLHYSSVLNELRFSRDPVALDVLSIQELARQRKAAGAPETGKPNAELYANAALLELGSNETNRIDVTTLENRPERTLSAGSP